MPVVSDSKPPKAVTPSASKTLFHYFSSKEASETSKKDTDPVPEKAKDDCEDDLEIVEELPEKLKKTSPGASKKRKKTQSDGSPSEIDSKELAEVGVKTSPTQSPVKKSSKLEKAKSAFAVLMSKDKPKEKVLPKVETKKESE